MAGVTAFVDDAVLGRLPAVRARDGVPTEGQFRITHEVGQANRLGILWLLGLAGPIGRVALVILASRSSGEHLTVTLHTPCELWMRSLRPAGCGEMDSWSPSWAAPGSWR